MTKEEPVPDIDALSEYLQAHLPGFTPPGALTKFATGQSNPTYALDTPETNYVVRCKPSGVLLKSAHAIDREYRVMRALANTTVPVPRTYLLCEDETVIGTAFYVMERVEGETYLDPRIPEFEADRTRRAAIYDQMNKTLVDIHRVDINAVDLTDFGRPGNYFARQIDRWTRQYRTTAMRADQNMDDLIDWLPRHAPADDGRVALVHGDFRIDNMIFSPSGDDVTAVLDWELSTLGHPFADLAYQCMQWRLPFDAPLAGLGGCDRDTLGLPIEAAYVKSYCDRAGIEQIENWQFYLSFSFFRLAAILEGVARRASEGNASSPHQARQLGAMVPDLARKGLEVIR